MAGSGQAPVFAKPSVTSYQLAARDTESSASATNLEPATMTSMTEADLRGIVRDAVTKRLAQHGLVPPSAVSSGVAAAPAWRTHVSHVRLVLSTGRDQEGPCLIEPVTRCSHCGYCQSYGH